MKHDGFSLLELLVASVVMAAAGELLIGGMVWANRSADLQTEQVLATQLLASHLASLDGPLNRQMPVEGTCPPPRDDFSWTLQWSEAPLAPLAETTITVKRKDHATHVVTYRPVSEP